jgi:hypothetical protein
MISRQAIVVEALMLVGSLLVLVLALTVRSSADGTDQNNYLGCSETPEPGWLLVACQELPAQPITTN